jgi:hypothetical protein
VLNVCNGGIAVIRNAEPNPSQMRERLEQRLRLGDLRKLRRRRKACQRGAEHVVGVDRATGGLIEPGQRQREEGGSIKAA